MLLHERIKYIIKSNRRLSQLGLARWMDLDASSINRMLAGTRKIRAEEIPRLEEYLGHSLDLNEYPVKSERLTKGAKKNRLRTTGEISQSNTSSISLIPVYTFLSLHPEPIDWTVRHPLQEGISDAFAGYPPSSAMEPRYYQSELIYIHPRRPMMAGHDLLILLKDGTATIQRLLFEKKQSLELQQFNPLKKQDLPKVKIKRAYVIIGRG